MPDRLAMPDRWPTGKGCRDSATDLPGWLTDGNGCPRFWMPDDQAEPQTMGTTMTALRFPRTIAQAMAAPWCDDVDDDRQYGGEFIIIQVRYDWLPETFPVSNVCSAHGETFREALDILRADLWDWIRDPATGEPVSSKPADWQAAGFALRVQPAA